MVDSRPFNSLGQILAQGGEIALARAIESGYSSQQIDALFDRRFNPVTQETRDELFALAEAGLAAGTAINELPPDQLIPLEMVPVNPDLFGDDSAGLRVFFLGRWRRSDSDRWFNVSGSLPDLTVYQDILDAILQAAGANINESPKKFGAEEASNPAELIGEVYMAERRF
jgi:hypothetical protein